MLPQDIRAPRREIRGHMRQVLERSPSGAVPLTTFVLGRSLVEGGAPPNGARAPTWPAVTARAERPADRGPPRPLVRWTPCAGESAWTSCVLVVVLVTCVFGPRARERRALPAL